MAVNVAESSSSSQDAKKSRSAMFLGGKPRKNVLKVQTVKENLFAGLSVAVSKKLTGKFVNMGWKDVKMECP